VKRLEDCISFLLAKAAQEVSRRAKEKLSPFGVSPAQYAVLKALWIEDGQSGAELGARLRLDSASITGIVDRLEASGLVERRSDSGDRRVHRLFPTARGLRLQGPLDAAMDELNAEVRRTIGADARASWSALRRLGQLEE
jgi:DNA-binding MarR family transcriptional regulator